MISGISNVGQSEPVNQPAAQPSGPKPETQSAGQGDSVQLSKIAQALLAARQEATETSAQTAKEAGHGDQQAQRLLAKEAAEKK